VKIANLFSKKMTLSFEVFPPKEEIPMTGILSTLSNLYKFKPDFISCTFGAGGSGRGRNIEVCTAVHKSGNLVMPHLTCIGSSRNDISVLVNEYTALGFENVLALRGDFPPGWDGSGCSAARDFSYADELIGFINAEFPQLCIAAAAYPEKHISAASMEADISCLLSKQDKGAQFAITQLCHDIRAFERFLEKIRRAGITIPIVAGIMPVLTCEPTIRMALFNGCSIPAELAAIMGKYQYDPESFAKAGMEYTVTQIRRFVTVGINGLHLYTLNKWKQLSEILIAAGLGDR
jgi:methylenetetrahydrofolate reductase (NADPH)